MSHLLVWDIFVLNGASALVNLRHQPSPFRTTGDNLRHQNTSGRAAGEPMECGKGQPGSDRVTAQTGLCGSASSACPARQHKGC